MNTARDPLPATRAGLTVPEILEMILLEVDMVTLLTSAQRVCKRWHDLIVSSPALQEGLFFAPVAEGTQGEAYDWEPSIEKEGMELSKDFFAWNPGPENLAWYPEIRRIRPYRRTTAPLTYGGLFIDARSDLEYLGVVLPPPAPAVDTSREQVLFPLCSRAGRSTVTATSTATGPSTEAAPSTGAGSPSSPVTRSPKRRKTQAYSFDEGPAVPKPATPPPCQPVFNPLLRYKFGPCFFDFGPTYGYLRRSESFYSMPWTTRPHQTVPNPILNGPPCRYQLVGPRDLNDGEPERARANRERFTRPGASWRRMLVSQPPPRAPPASRMARRSVLAHTWSRSDGLLDERLPGQEWASTGFVTASATGHSPEEEQVLRMGLLYDLVQSNIGDPGPQRWPMWFRVTWGAPKPPFCTSVQQAMRELLAPVDPSGSMPSSLRGVTAPVAVEFLQLNRETAFNHHQEETGERFDADFRCAETQSIPLNGLVMIAEQGDVTEPMEYGQKFRDAVVSSYF